MGPWSKPTIPTGAPHGQDPCAGFRNRCVGPRRAQSGQPGTERHRRQRHARTPDRRLPAVLPRPRLDGDGAGLLLQHRGSDDRSVAPDHTAGAYAWQVHDRRFNVAGGDGEVRHHAVERAPFSASGQLGQFTLSRQRRGAVGDFAWAKQPPHTQNETGGQRQHRDVFLPLHLVEIHGPRIARNPPVSDHPARGANCRIISPHIATATGRRPARDRAEWSRNPSTGQPPRGATAEPHSGAN